MHVISVASSAAYLNLARLVAVSAKDDTMVIVNTSLVSAQGWHLNIANVGEVDNSTIPSSLGGTKAILSLPQAEKCNATLSLGQ